MEDFMKDGNIRVASASIDTLIAMLNIMLMKLKRS